MMKRLLLKLLYLLNGTRLSYRFHLRYWYYPDVKVTADILNCMRPSRALRPEVTEVSPEKRILVIAPHPDDEMIGPGGTLIKARETGSEVNVVCLSDGETNKDLGKIRIKESKHVSAKFGFEYYNLGMQVGELQPDQFKKRSLGLIIQKINPNIIFVPFILDDNDDHRHSAILLSETLKELEQSNDIEIWAYQVYSSVPANVIVPIDRVVKKKESAIRLYHSQMAIRDWSNYALGLNAYSARLTPRSCSDKFVEAFFVLPVKEFTKLSDKYFSAILKSQ